MRSFLAALLIAGVTAQTTSDYLACAEAALDGIDTSKFSDCTDLSSTECVCANKDAITDLSDSAKAACKDAGVDLSKLSSSMCSDSDTSTSPARHASKPMEPATGFGVMAHKRAYRPEEPALVETAAPRVIYVTETRTECSCKSTPFPHDPMHVSQIPVDVPMSSSMGAMVAASSPAYSNGIMVGASSSAMFGSQMSAATPTPSGASANRFNTFKGAAPKTNAVGGVAAVAVAAVLGLMVAL
ncbi:hypothetical protein N7462_002287 [Penicillium macrosclerotiorum]|uniref:uncharacterized protein n=1 Tax=Penicillium macrosclerotiorum TaxID=303699 RepID=UPI0025470195|nr:uncharacterized protein N7462_002287 [Penicillium macrosclerotiorum]KAJ5692864.1 hypothetical protein N7462_002287 [Penicillium macrosclerotiorum]